MADAASGANQEAMLNSIVSESVWGSYDEPCGIDDWKMYSPIPSRDPPSSKHVTYGEYLEDIVKADRPTRKHLKSHFTSLVAPEAAPAFTRLRECMVNHKTSPPCTYHIVPSFFRLIDVLQQRGVEFTLVFRTFGVDTEPVMEEFNRFCCGNHELSQTASPHTSRRIAGGSVGVLRRSGADAQSMQLTLGNGQVTAPRVEV